MDRVLMKFFKLPPAVKLMLALAGFGGLAPVLFFLLPALKSRQAKVWIIIALAGVCVIVAAIWGLRRLLGRKKSGQLANALETQGPTRGDIAEQEQIYREKFRAKLNELKANGLSVYKLPWFVLMGEPGCGKTATLINSGLDFPLGKDEVPGFGGTRNYNWWFTNDAVILDTAGRIAFQEEGTTDKVEWEYFIKLLKSNRPRCPVNGVLVAVPADKLLRDSSEERAQKASILRERLRQIHQLLGVRFPTFIVVTKMDLVGGFNEFFGEIRPDLQQRNQMFGWSRPDEFQSPYDPSGFPDAFDNVYQRLRAWAMRYLQRPHATEEELGLVVTFPEAFRQLRQPLYDYVATIFQKSPLLEPPFFRGFYFTSSVQEGAPIFDVFARRHAGAVVAARPTRPVESRAFFIHDLYARKVFPEQGLVFRSAKHVTLNKRMRRLVWTGSGALVGLLLLFVTVGAFGFRSLVLKPRDDCAEARKRIVEASEKGRPAFGDLAANLELARKLSGHVERYDGFWKAVSARLMFILADPDVPKGLVSQIHSKFVLVTLVEPTVREFAARVREAKLPPDGASLEQRKLFLAGLEQFARWYGETVGQGTWGRELSREEAKVRAAQFDAILASLGTPGPSERQEVVAQVERALRSLAGQRVFARDVLRPHVPDVGDAAVLTRAVERMEQFWRPSAAITADHSSKGVVFWVTLCEKLRQVRMAYGDILGLAPRLRDESQFAAAAAEFLRQTTDVAEIEKVGTAPLESDTFVAKWYDLRDFLRQQAGKLPERNGRIQRLSDLFDEARARWDEEFGRLRAALGEGAPRTAGVAQAESVYQAIQAAQDALQALFDRNLAELRTALGIPEGKEPLEYFRAQKILDAREAADAAAAAGEKPSIDVSPEAFGQRGWLKLVLNEMRQLVDVSSGTTQKLDDFPQWPALIEEMAANRPADLQLQWLGQWFEAVGAEVAKSGERLRVEEVKRRFAQERAQFHPEQTFWNAGGLYDVAEAAWSGRQRVTIGGVLEGMAQRLTEALRDGEPGLARLRTSYRDAPADMPFDRHRFNVAVAEPAEPQRTPEPQAQPGREDELQLGARREAPRPSDRPDDAALGTAAKLLLNYHTRAWLADTLQTYLQAKSVLSKVPGGEKVGGLLDAAAERYIDTYFIDWFNVYSDYTRLLDADTLELIERCAQGTLGWPQFQAELKERGRKIGAAVGERITWLAREAVLFDQATQYSGSDDPRFALIQKRLAALRGGQTNRSLVHLLLDLRKYRGDARGGAIEDALARDVQLAWEDYVRQVTDLGPLDDSTPRRGGKLTAPDVKLLIEDKLQPQRVVGPGFHLTLPLADLARHGQRLLGHHLESKLAAILERPGRNGCYPVVAAGAVPDPNERNAELRALPTIPPEQFLVLLREVSEFRRDYEELFNAVVTDLERNRATLSACRRWQEFLFGPSDPADWTKPQRVGVRFALDPDERPKNTRNPGGFCEEVCVTLPLLLEIGGPAQQTCVPTRGSAAPAAAASTTQWEHFWHLTGELATQETRAEIKRVTNEGVQLGFKEGAAAWTLPPGPWSLPLLFQNQGDSASDRKWLIPVVVRSTSSGEVPIGMSIRVEFERPFPGTIPPLSAPAPLAGMQNAATYLAASARR